MKDTNIRAPVERVALSVAEAAQSMGVSENTLRALINARPDFPSIKISANRIIVPVQPLRDWLAKQVNIPTT